MNRALLTIYLVDEKGKKVKNGEVPSINDGTYGNYKKLLLILEMYLVSLGINQAKEILFIADGADWYGLHIPLLLNRDRFCRENLLSFRFLSWDRTFTGFCAQLLLIKKKKEKLGLIRLVKI